MKNILSRQHQSESAMGVVEIQNTVVFLYLFARICKGGGVNGAVEERVQTTQRVKRCAGITEGVEQSMCDIHCAVKIGEWIDKEARIYQTDNGKYGFSNSAGVGVVVLCV